MPAVNSNASGSPARGPAGTTPSPRGAGPGTGASESSNGSGRHTYFAREVKPHVADAWIDETKTKIGYEIPFTGYFYKYKPLRPLAEIEAEIRALEGEIQGMLGEVLR